MMIGNDSDNCYQHGFSIWRSSLYVKKNFYLYSNSLDKRWEDGNRFMRGLIVVSQG